MPEAPSAAPRGRAARLRTRVWRAWYRGRWVLWQRRVVARPHIAHVAGLHLVVLPGVLDPAVFLTSDVLADAIATLMPGRDTLLDLGTGCGIGALAACAAGASHVVAVDLDPVACRCARASVLLAAAESVVEVREGDLFGPLDGERFDLVAFNPPFLAPGDTGAYALALHGPPDLPERFASGLADHLTPRGLGLVILSSAADPERWLAPLRTRGYRAEAIVTRDRGSETIVGYRLTPEVEG